MNPWFIWLQLLQRLPSFALWGLFLWAAIVLQRRFPRPGTLLMVCSAVLALIFVLVEAGFWIWIQTGLRDGTTTLAERTPLIALLHYGTIFAAISYAVSLVAAAHSLHASRSSP